MHRSRFNDEQIVAILRESDRTSVAEAYKRTLIVRSSPAQDKS
jgi:hypothetical protein